jgi:predicted dehydrogenase
MPRLRVAFIGAGRIADLHVLGYRNNPDAELVAVCALHEAAARRRAEEWGIARWTTDAGSLFASAEVDAVEILTPHDTHAPLTIAGLEAGKQVSVQKPMALNMREALSMIQAAQRTGRVLRVYENFRFYPPYVEAKRLLEAGEIGEPLSIRIKAVAGRSPTGWFVPPEAWAWRFDEARSGGGPFAFDHGYHVFSIAMYFLGAVSKVFAWIDRSEHGPGATWDTQALIAWRHREGGQMGTWHADVSGEFHIRSKYYQSDEWVEITGTRGILWINRCSGMMLEMPSVVMYRDGQTTAYHDIETDWASSFDLCTREFTTALREGRQPEVNPLEGAEILRFALAAQLSARKGREVTLDEVPE